MLAKLRSLYAQMILSTPAARRRWAAYYSIHLPILAPALKDNPYARLLTLRTLDAIQNKKPTQAAAKRLYRLHFLCDSSSKPDRALYNFLCGMYAEMRGNHEEMARRFRIAAKFGHTYHLLHANLGMYYLFERHDYDRTLEELNKAIDCIYSYLPLDDAKHLIIARFQARMAFSLVMMHRPDDAEAMLAKAAPAAEGDESLHALAMLRAVQGRRTEAETALTALKARNETIGSYCEENMRLVLDGTHPHFVAGAPDRQGIDAYWAWFRKAESELLWLLSEEDYAGCFKLHDPHFSPLTPEPSHIDQMAVGFQVKDGQPQFHLQAKHSRNYNALIDALIDACPPEISSRWQIIRKP